MAVPNLALPETIHEGRFLRMVRRGKWEYVERHGASGVIAIVALTDDQRLLLVEQFRPPLQASVIELPAGLAGDIAGAESEPLEVAAARELVEETGYEAREIRWLTSGPTSAGLTNEVVTIFAMTGLTKVSAGGGDASESIVVHEIPIGELPDWLEARRQAGCAIDPKIYAGLYWVTCGNNRDRSFS